MFLIMATFKSTYTTSELLNLLKKRSLNPYYWVYDGEYTFFFVDNRRDYSVENGYICIYSHRSNYYRLRNKLNFLPFGLDLDSRTKRSSVYRYTLYPDSVFLNEGSSEKLNQLNEQSQGNLSVRVVVI